MTCLGWSGFLMLKIDTNFEKINFHVKHLSFN